MPFNTEIQIATNEDHSEIMNLLESVEVPTEGINPDFTRFFVVRDDFNKIIGCIGMELFIGTALLRSFAVDPLHQGNQIGSSLVERVLEESFENGSAAVYLCTAKAPQLFLKLGFVGIDLDDVPDEIRDSVLFKRNCPIVAVYMKKRVA